MELEKTKNQLIIRLDGDLDHHYAAKVRSAVDGAVMAGDVTRVIFDFSGVGFMDSSGIGVIMGRYKLMRSIGGSVAVFGFSPTLDKLIAMSGIKKIVEIYKTEQEAERGVS